ncbi:MAG: YbhB/YbcL family Raf kinase inhibitor-like protein [Patescibacteria group bacterium]|nr:YbhB/YbcL family Raf kinase inhibitor-like protein [Patescibacteria group bacterium]
MTITSPAFADGQPIPKKYTCDGDGVNPPLAFSGVPKEAGSLALVIDDPDAPSGTWTHWTLWNIDPATLLIAENSVPSGAVQGQTSSGQNAYGGPCPPSGTHHYYFKLYALDSKLTIPSFADSRALAQALNGHVMSQAQLVGTYSR